MGELKDIIIYKEGQELGPFSGAEIRRHWANGVVDGTDFAWHPGLDEWIYVRDLFKPPKMDPVTASESTRIPRKN
jgi:hypothetical protein